MSSYLVLMSINEWGRPSGDRARRSDTDAARVVETALEPPLALWRRVFSEYVGSALLAAIVIGSGIAAQTLSPHAIGLELLENAAATGVGLYALILSFGPVSGAHFNPAVTLVDALFGHKAWREVPGYCLAQIAGCATGAVLANLMFSRAAFSVSVHERATGAHLLAEVVATAGLIVIIFALARSHRGQAAASAVGAYIAAAYFFTSSTSFANPAITIGRTLSNSFAGIAPSSVAGFIGAQLLGAGLGYLLIRTLYPLAVSPPNEEMSSRD